MNEVQKVEYEDIIEELKKQLVKLNKSILAKEDKLKLKLLEAENNFEKQTNE